MPIVSNTMPPEQNSSATNQTSVDQPVELRRSSDVWFDDGNYALQAENVVFKVYGGILSKYSSTFQTLLSLPQPVAEEERSMYENSPLIPLVGDSAHDVECYLKALFDLQLYADVTKIRDVNLILGVVNMSLKYDTEILIRRSLPAFTAIYPASLTKWDIRTQRRQFTPFAQAYGRALPFVVIDIAKKTGLDVLLPSAMLECCGYSIEDIMHGVAAPNGAFYHLDRQSQVTILQARGQLAHDAHMQKVKFAHAAELAFPAQRRSTNSNVQNSWTRLAAWASKIDGPDNWVDPLALEETWPADAYNNVMRMGMSPAETMKKRLKERRAAVWRDLPVAMGMHKWDKLRRVWIH